MKLLLVCVFVLLVGNGSAMHPDFGLNMTELVTKYGYPIEFHEVQTDDGYIIGVHRIPHGKNADKATKDPIFLNHGLMSNSMDWVNMGPEKSLGFLLAEAGYDVWMGNSRGNRHSRKHVSIDPDTDPKTFFAFSFHEIGVYDLPACIDYVLKETGAASLNYIGHSQGTSSFFAMAAEKPEYNEKIKLMVALAPVAYMEHSPHPLFRILTKYYDILNPIFEALPIYELLRYTEDFQNLAKNLCYEDSPFKEICAIIYFEVGGFDSPQLDRDFIPVILTSSPAGASKNQFLHYYQEINSTNFAQYDYGSENQAHYGQDSPPKYDISKITTPIILYYAKNDWLTAVVDVEKFAKELPNLKASNLIEYELFTHLDYLWAIDIVELLNNDVVAVFDEVN